MNMNRLRRAIVGVALASGALALVAGPVFAAGPNPQGPPNCGGVASLINYQIMSDAAPGGTGARGDNFISIPGVAEFNNHVVDSPAFPNGFKQLCSVYGLVGSGSAVKQFDPEDGTIETYNCNQPVANEWTPGQGAFLATTELASLVTDTGMISGVECARTYATYARGTIGAAGDHIFPVPLTIAATEVQDVCDQLNLRDIIPGTCPTTSCTTGLIGNGCSSITPSTCDWPGDSTQYVDAVAGTANDFKCGQAGGGASLVLGRGLRIEPTPVGRCDLAVTGGTGTLVCTHGKVGNACASHVQCNLVPANGVTPGDVASTGTVTIF